jgi:hypothetical protein
MPFRYRASGKSSFYKAYSLLRVMRWLVAKQPIVFLHATLILMGECNYIALNASGFVL